MQNNGKLLWRLRDEYLKAQKYEFLQLFPTFVLIALAICSLFIGSELPQYFFAVASLATLGIKIWLVGLHSQAKAASNSARRAVMLLEGLGGTLNLINQVALFDKLNAAIAHEETIDPKVYYASQQKKGSSRLLELVEESAFYSSKTHKASGRFYVALIAIFAIVAAAIVLFALPKADNGTLIFLIRVLIVLSIYTLSIDVFGKWRSFKSSWSAFQSIYQRCAGIEASGADVNDSLLLLLDYISAVEASPVTLMRAYSRKEKAKIDALWKTYLSSKLLK